MIMENAENAFVHPSGDIFVYAGMLQRCHSEDEVAAILAHELALASLQAPLQDLEAMVGQVAGTGGQAATTLAQRILELEPVPAQHDH